MPAVKLDFCEEGLKTFFTSKKNEFDYDLSNASCVEIMQTFEKFKRKLHPSFKTSQVYKNLQKIEEIVGCEIMPVHITDEFYVRFEIFLHAQGIRPSTIKSYFNMLACALSWASKHGCRLQSTYNTYSIDEYEREKVALSPEQVTTIYNFDFSKILVRKKLRVHGKTINELRPKLRADKIKNLERIRDQFVLMCNLGQRYSDAKRIEKDFFDNDCKKVYFIQQKTGNKAVVNLDTMCITPSITRRILDKYNYNAPYPHDISNFNKCLHEILSLIGGEFVEPIKSTNKINGVLVDEVIPMYKAISSHTARRTFITYNILNGKVPDAVIRRASGHHDQRSFDKYFVPND